MTQSKVQKASEAVRVLDRETQDLLTSVRVKNNKALLWFVISWTVLFILGVFGIFRQNQIANQNKQHIDCVVKLFTTPLPRNARSRSLSNPSTTCDIKFSP